MACANVPSLEKVPYPVCSNKIFLESNVSKKKILGEIYIIFLLFLIRATFLAQYNFFGYLKIFLEQKSQSISFLASKIILKCLISFLLIQVQWL